MSSIKNNFGVIGHIGEISTVEKDGKKTTNFSLASNYKNGETEKVTWFNLTAFGKLAEVLEKNVKKGAQVAVSGHMNNNNFEDKEGVKRYQMSFVADEVIFLSKKED